MCVHMVSSLTKQVSQGYVSISMTVAETLLSSASATFPPLRQRVLISDSNQQLIVNAECAGGIKLN